MSELVDLEVGRYALRTFRFIEDRVYPVAFYGQSDDAWQDGTCVARCYACPTLNVSNWKRHHAPDLDCSCGIYGSLAFSTLQRQYGALTSAFIGVIAAEGPTVVGSRGLRTARARVVAYWSDDHAWTLDEFSHFFLDSMLTSPYDYITPWHDPRTGGLSMHGILGDTSLSRFPGRSLSRGVRTVSDICEDRFVDATRYVDPREMMNNYGIDMQSNRPENGYSNASKYWTE